MENIRQTHNWDKWIEGSMKSGKEWKEILVNSNAKNVFHVPEKFKKEIEKSNDLTMFYGLLRHRLLTPEEMKLDGVTEPRRKWCLEKLDKFTAKSFGELIRMKGEPYCYHCGEIFEKPVEDHWCEYANNHRVVQLIERSYDMAKKEAIQEFLKGGKPKLHSDWLRHLKTEDGW